MSTTGKLFTFRDMIIEQVEGTLNMAYNLDGDVLHIDDHDDDFIVDFLKGLNEVIDDNSRIAEILGAAVPLRLGGGDRSDEFSREMREVISRVKVGTRQSACRFFHGPARYKLRRARQQDRRHRHAVRSEAAVACLELPELPPMKSGSLRPAAPGRRIAARP
jgi:hypothetical protein